MNLKVLYHGSENHPYNLHISLQILKRASLVGLRSVVYLLSAFYIQTKLTHAFSVKATYTPPLAYLKLRKLSFPYNCTGYWYVLVTHIMRFNELETGNLLRFFQDRASLTLN